MDIGSVKSPAAATPMRPAGVEVNRSAAAGAVPSQVERPVVSLARSVEVASEEQQASRGQVEDAVSTIQDFVQSVRRNLNFQLDDSSGRVVVKVTDGQSGDVIRQIPSEEALKLAESLDEVRSLLFKAEA